MKGKATKPTPAAVAACMNRPLERWPSRARPADAAAWEAAAMEDLLGCMQAMQRDFITGEDDAFIAFRIHEIAVFAGETLAAMACQGSLEAAADLIHLRVAVDAAIQKIPAGSRAAEIALGTSAEIRKSRKPIGSPRGGRKVDWSTPDNRTVLELFGRIEAYRRRWQVMAGDAAAKGLLDPIPAACVALDDFGPGTWLAWHEAGKMILRAERQSASSHLRAAWERLSKVPFSMPSTARNWY